MRIPWMAPSARRKSWGDEGRGVVHGDVDDRRGAGHPPDAGPGGEGVGEGGGEGRPFDADGVAAEVALEAGGRAGGDEAAALQEGDGAAVLARPRRRRWWR